MKGDPGQPSFTSLSLAIDQLKKLLADRHLLIVIDDAWHREHLEPFVQGGPRCARLITTRNFDILPKKAQQVKVDAMQPGEAILLLGANLAPRSEQPPPQRDADEITRELHALADRLGKWALLVKLVNGTLHNASANSVNRCVRRLLTSTKRSTNAG